MDCNEPLHIIGTSRGRDLLTQQEIRMPFDGDDFFRHFDASEITQLVKSHCTYLELCVWVLVFLEAYLENCGAPALTEAELISTVREFGFEVGLPEECVCALHSLRAKLFKLLQRRTPDPSPPTPTTPAFAQQVPEENARFPRLSRLQRQILLSLAQESNPVRHWRLLLAVTSGNTDRGNFSRSLRNLETKRCVDIHRTAAGRAEFVEITPVGRELVIFDLGDNSPPAA